MLENDGEYQRWKIERRNALRIDRDRAKQERVRRDLAALRERAAEGLGPAAVEPAAKRSPDPAVRQGVQVADRVTQTPPAQPSRGADVDLGGGGAIDPLTAGIAAALAGLGLRLGRRRRER